MEKVYKFEGDGEALLQQMERDRPCWVWSRKEKIHCLEVKGAGREITIANSYKVLTLCQALF